MCSTVITRHPNHTAFFTIRACFLFEQHILLRLWVGHEPMPHECLSFSFEREEWEKHPYPLGWACHSMHARRALLPLVTSLPAVTRITTS
jgi:hypothetical protein